MKKILLSIVLICLIAYSTDQVLDQFNIFSKNGHSDQTPSVQTKSTDHLKNDPLNMAYTIENDSVTLKDGKGTTTAAEDAAITSTVMVFGTPTYGDFDQDGDSDAAVVLVQQSGGTGSFYYATLAINDGGRYKSTNTLFLGDRITPQTVEIHAGKAVFNFADRKEDEPMAAPPSVSKRVTINFDSKSNTIAIAP